MVAMYYIYIAVCAGLVQQAASLLNGKFHWVYSQEFYF